MVPDFSGAVPCPEPPTVCSWWNVHLGSQTWAGRARSAAAAVADSPWSGAQGSGQPLASISWAVGPMMPENFPVRDDPEFTGFATPEFAGGNPYPRTVSNQGCSSLSVSAPARKRAPD